jgi:hypothetical protein
MRRRFCVAGCKRGGRKEGWMDGKKKEEEGGRKMEWREMGWILSIRSRVALDGGGSDSFLGDDKSYIGGSHDGHTHTQLDQKDNADGPLFSLSPSKSSGFS